MKKFLLPEDGQFYKANLHSHSTLSDGNLTPQQMKEAYKAAGYSVLAITDHNLFVAHPELRDPDFLPLYGFEAEVNLWVTPDYADAKTCHLCFVSLNEENRTPVCWHRTKYLGGNTLKNAYLVQFDPNEPDYEREYTPAGINDMIRRGREKDFFVTYNHPTWSQESYPEYSQYMGMSAVELFNTGASLALRGYDSHVYDDLLRQGKRLFCIYADDNHNFSAPGKVDWDSFKNYIMIKSPVLDYPHIAEALRQGHFYASQGPSIYSLTFEDGVVSIECSNAYKIIYTTARRRFRWAEGSGAKFTVKPEDRYFRLTVYAEDGKIADTNAYFTDELFR